MKKLSKQTLNRTCQFIIETGRPLEQALCRHHFRQASPASILAALGQFQNEDGGFGHGLESDFRLPDSSPLATSVGFQILIDYDHLPEAQKIVHLAIQYLETSYMPRRKGWLAVPPQVNNYPHTPWWHFNPDTDMTDIDEHWGNPSAELVGYLYKYSKYANKLDLDHLLTYAIQQLHNKETFEFHETFSYIRLYNLLPGKLAEQIEARLTEAVIAQVNINPETWETDYSPKPLDFVGKSRNRFGISQSQIDANLQYYIAKLEQNGHILPTWGKQFYEEALAPAWDEWLAQLTLNTLLLLKKYHRIQ